MSKITDQGYKSCEREINSRKSDSASEENNIPVVYWQSSSFAVPIKIKTPLVPIRVCAAVLGMSEHSVINLVESGRFSWVWDFRRKNANRSFIFVLALSLQEYQERCEHGGNLCVWYPHDWDTILKIVLPHEKLLIKGSELVRNFSISSQHMMNLVSDGLLEVINKRRGRTSTPLITRESVVRFLKMRKIG